MPSVALLLAACTGSGSTPPDACAGAPTWDNFAQGYVQTWCQPCHSSLLTGPERQGAPETMNFDRWSEVWAQRDRVQARGVDYLPSPMPPQGGVPPDDVERLGQWLACGAQGEDPPPGPCDALRTGPATTIGSQADALAFCAAYNAADALTVTGTATVDCLCEVTGALTQTGGELDLPLLGSAGSLDVSGAALRAPELESVAGDVVAGGSLAELSLPSLLHLGGNLELRDLPALASVDVSDLYDVGGELVLTEAPLLETFSLPRLRTVGDDLVLQGLDGLVLFTDTRSLSSVGGSLILRDLPLLEVLDDWMFLLLTDVGGDVVVSDNRRLAAIHGFTSLGQSLGTDLAPTFQGSLLIEDDPGLKQIPGFDLLYHVGGDVRIRADASLDTVLGLENLARVDGALVLEDLPDATSLPFEDLASVGELRISRVNETSLADFPSLVSVDRDLTIDGCPHLGAIRGLPKLTTVGQDLSLADNPLLIVIDGLDALQTVGRDLDVVGNLTLPASVVDPWVAGLAVGGATTVENNGP